MPPFADSLDKDEYVPMAGNPPSESLASDQEAASLYHEDIIPESTRDDLLSVIPGSSFPADAFCKTAETIFIDPSHESIVPRDLITSYFEAECDISKLEILEDIMNYFQDPAPGKRRETFIVSPFNDRINFLVRYSAHSHERSLTILGTSDVIRNVPAWLVQLIDTIFCIMRLRVSSFEPKVFSWFLEQQRLGLTLIAQLGRFVHLGTDPSDIQSISMFPAIEDIRNDGFWDFAGSDIDIDLRAKSSSYEDKDGLYSDIEQESDQSYGAQSDTAEFSSQEDSVPDAYAKAPVKAKATPVIPTFTEADLIFPLTQPDDLKLAALFAASIQVTQLQTLVYYSCKEASYCLATAAIDWVSVSIVAEGLAPSDLKGLYAPEVCSQLYESDEHAEFRRKALLGPNWERLRGISSFEGMQPQEGDPFGLNDRCPGKCSNCKDARDDEGHEIVCFHPPSTSRKPCKRCVEMGDDLDRGCDGGWRRSRHRGCKTGDEADEEDDETSEHAETDDDSESCD
ncbi:uncharacterized protein FPRO_00494 [Fusarium proliferatum ET1]|uniref:Uncharacterized protein n=1 Tax=Fusarium proliferatum (strain ET1) TaxID=1227346 RepID=A0A1L7V3B1_FUSPR|nr:uncharacterized protein FPRO_00494 [Fusarium proliferatum ET1]CZR35383.1 uncharacterized protein FPRO_00494 [Fusarium proliferatum ET1]